MATIDLRTVHDENQIWWCVRWTSNSLEGKRWASQSSESSSCSGRTKSCTSTGGQPDKLEEPNCWKRTIVRKVAASGKCAQRNPRKANNSGVERWLRKSDHWVREKTRSVEKHSYLVKVRDSLRTQQEDRKRHPVDQVGLHRRPHIDTWTERALRCEGVERHRAGGEQDFGQRTATPCCTD